MIKHYVSIGLLVGALAFSAHAQPSLQSLVSDADAGWMFGQWQAQTDNGDTVSLGVTWDLDKHAVVLHLKTSDMESKSYTVIEPGAELPKYYSFDNKGAVGKGSWNMENGELVLRIESQKPEGGSWKAGFVFAGSASAGLQVRMHGIDGSGDLATPAQMTFKFKKQK